MLLLVQIPLILYLYLDTAQTGNGNELLFAAIAILFSLSIVLFMKMTLAEGGITDLRYAPLLAVTLFIIPRAVHVYQSIQQRGLYINPTFQMRLAFGLEDYTFSISLILISLLLYMSTCLALRSPHKQGSLPVEEAGSLPLDWSQQPTRIVPVLFTLAVVCSALDLGLKVLSFGSLASMLGAVTSAQAVNQLAQVTGSGVTVVFRTMAILYLAACIVLGQSMNARWKSGFLLLAIVLFIVGLVERNRASALFPLVAGFLAWAVTHRWSFRLSHLVLLVVSGPVVRVLLSIRHGAGAAVELLSEPVNSWWAWVSEGFVFDVYVLLVSYRRPGLLEPGLGILSRSLSYFVPRLLLDGPKAGSADFQLSVLLGLASRGAAYGTPPTLFGGMFWYFGTLGPMVAFIVIALILSLLNRMISRSDLASSRASVFVRAILVKIVVFVAVVDIIRVGVLMREILTLGIHLGAVFIVFLTVEFLERYPQRRLGLHHHKTRGRFRVYS